ncbi:MAG TPA: hypothetical protein VEY30_12850 [Myxococcaceae bacterium]|nr:hypothetical protein [Myxococcaceae bacterium]
MIERTPDTHFAEAAEALLQQMVEGQREKVIRLAREAVPNLGLDDVLNPHDHPELKAHPTFEYEDGILAGLISAQIALRAEFRTRFEAPR